MTVFAVTPVVDYEPPGSDVRRCRQPSPASPRHRAPRRARTTQTGRPPPQAPTSAPMRAAGAFADAALRRVLEVIDRRRPAAQLRPMLAPGLVESVLAIGRSATGHARGHSGAAVLRRMRLQPSGHRETAAEVAGSYSRGDRIHAIACRVEQAPTGEWQVVALHIG